jgi:nitrile hydratase subunit beta
MNGIHDTGGMHGYGPVGHEANEPVFHELWEGRLYAISRLLRAWRRSNLDTDRHSIELIPPDEYLRLPYYERWLRRLLDDVVRFGFVTREELETGRAAAGAPKATPPLTAATVSRVLARGIPSAIDPGIRPRFKVGEHVRTHNINPVGHTRLPRYARARSGVIIRDHGVHRFPDTNAHGKGEKRQHVYAVQFTAQELWGPQASTHDYVHLDLWDDYLSRT